MWCPPQGTQLLQQRAKPAPALSSPARAQFTAKFRSPPSLPPAAPNHPGFSSPLPDQSSQPAVPNLVRAGTGSSATLVTPAGAQPGREQPPVLGLIGSNPSGSTGHTAHPPGTRWIYRPAPRQFPALLQSIREGGGKASFPLQVMMRVGK